MRASRSRLPGVDFPHFSKRFRPEFEPFLGRLTGYGYSNDGTALLSQHPCDREVEALQKKADVLEKRRLELDQEVASLKEGAAKEVAALETGLFLEQ